MLCSHGQWIEDFFVSGVAEFIAAQIMDSTVMCWVIVV